MRLFISLTALLCFSANAYEINGKVIKITDGDTVYILDADRESHKIRLSGIDAPEKKQPFGNKSKQMLSGYIFGKQVTADCTAKDRYKRDICTIIKDGKDINAQMVTNGGAWVYRKYYKGEHYYLAEKFAQDNKLGLWNTSEYQAIPPWEWRKRK